MMAEICVLPLPDLQAQNEDLQYQLQCYRSWHQRAVTREQTWKKRALALGKVIREQAGQIRQLEQQVQKLKARASWLEQQLFSPQSERLAGAAQTANEQNDPAAAPVRDGPAFRRHRGQQPGVQGHGRKRHRQLPVQEVIYDLDEEHKCCPRCGKPFAAFPGTEDAEEIEWDERFYRRLHRRRRYRPTCTCHGVSGIVTAPAPAKLIPKGMFSIGFWVHLLLEKYLWQRPLSRTLKRLELEGLDLSQGTLTGGLRRL
jgi:transposase